MKMIKKIEVAGKPQEVLLSPDGTRAWASAFGPAEVAEIDADNMVPDPRAARRTAQRRPGVDSVAVDGIDPTSEVHLKTP